MRGEVHAPGSNGLATGWELVSVRDVARYINGLAFKPADWGTEGRPIIRIQNLTDPTKPFNFTRREVDANFIVKPGTILVSWSATLDAFIWRGPEAVLNQHIFRVDPDCLIVHPGFLYWQLKRVIREMWEGEHLHGSTMKHINRAPFLAHAFRLAPFAEQARIVGELEKHFTRLDEAVATLEAVQAKLKRARASILKAAVEGRLVPTEADLARAEGRSYEPASVLLKRILDERRQTWPKEKKYQEPLEPEAPSAENLPEGWTWTTVDQVSSALRYGTSAKCSVEDTGVPVLRMGNIVDGRLDFNDLKYLPSDHDEFPDHLLAVGELLFNRTNSAELVGKCTVFDGFVRPCACASYIIRVALLSGVQPHYLAHCINSLRGRSWVREVVSQQVGQANVNGSKLAAHVFPLPPLAEQVRIVAEVERRLSVFEALAHTVEQSLARCGRLRQSILKRAFEGRLLPQDPTDEPASELLARIRAQPVAEASA